MRGFVFDAILISTIWQFETEDVRMIKNWSSLLRDKGAYFTGDDFNRTAAGDMELRGDEQTGQFNVERGAFVDWDFLGSSIADLECDPMLRHTIMSYAVAALFTYRMMGYTENRHLGVFPEAALEGDMIAAFHGGQALYVIRPTSGEQDKYHFIGECYVDQMMDGQAMELASEREIESKMLTLV